MTDKAKYSSEKDAELKKWEATVNLWKAKAQKVEADAKADYENLLQDLGAKQDAARTKLDKLKNSSGEAWQELRKGLESSFGELRSALDKATEKFS